MMVLVSINLVKEQYVGSGCNLVTPLRVKMLQSSEQFPIEVPSNDLTIARSRQVGPEVEGPKTY